MSATAETSGRRTVLITGSSSGIGRALCSAFASAGYRVFAAARREEDLAQLEEAGWTPIALDVNDDEAIVAAVATLQAQAGGLDVLVNNAGYGAMGPVLDFDRDRLRHQFETNVLAPVALTRACLPLLRDRGGSVINVGSVAGLLSSPFAGAYCASKAALHRLTEAMRMELDPFGIDVILVRPGAVASNFGQRALSDYHACLAPDSPWQPWQEAIDQRAISSERLRPAPADKLARRVTNALERQRRPRLIRAGQGGIAVALAAQWLPEGLRERVLIRYFGLHERR
ncbi:SDR family oxidoreductase [Kushneria phosphatilytica]|uniref:SDR family oxidoreductase n=1 Tax=Kushneria phosphatilytica TaxID=657387 RepID=A0A1S1NRV1_9GAMM|nr:SDR family oxidoreductase [Kushneria phosphatilytica]OHV07659.1 short-chain dehydrogenase [Kushneria phosphatilytica]QEL10150.1 SDR family oxidoreductase [Kushneria phosphatilytica]